MKKILFALCFFALAHAGFSQAPQGINYQGVARDNQGQAFGITNISVQITFQNGSGMVYQEHQTVTTDTFGLYNIVIGSAAAVVTHGTFASIPWSAGNLLAIVDIDPTGTATNWTTVSTMNLQSVPYALYAQSSGSTSGITSLTVGPGLTSSGSPITSTGTVDLPSFSGVAGAWGNSTSVPTFTVDNYGRITGASTNTISGGLPTGVNGQMLFNNGTNWTPSNTSNLFFSGTNLGMGTTSPSALIDLQSTTGTTTLLNAVTTGSGFTAKFSGGAGVQVDKIQIGGATTNGYVLTSDPSGNASWQPSAGGGFWSQSADTLYPTNSAARIAIGTTSPNATIHAVSSNTFATLYAANSYTAPAALFESIGTAGDYPALQALSNNTNGYAIRADANGGAAILANTNAYYAVSGNIGGGTGRGVAGWLRSGTTSGYGVEGLVDNTSFGSAGNFENQNTSNTQTVLLVTNAGTGHSAIFSGGSGVQIDSLEVQTNLHIPLNANPGWVLTSDPFGNASWAPHTVTASGPITGNGTAGSPLQLGLNNGNIFIGNASNLAVPVVMSGDVTITGAGLATVNGLQGRGILPGVPSANQVLQFNGSNWTSANIATLPAGTAGQMLFNNGSVWTPSNTSNLVFTGTNLGIGNGAPSSPLDVASSGSTPSIKAVNSGSAAEAGVFNVTGSANNSAALVANTTGTGHAFVANAAGGNAVNATTSGTTGVAGFFQNSNLSNNNPVVNVVASAAGPGVNINAQGPAPGIASICNTSNGSAALFQTNNASSTLAAVSITSNANSSPAMVVSNTGSGAAPAATFSVTNATASATAVAINNAGGGAGLSVNTMNDGVNVMSSGVGGSAAHFQNTSTSNNNPVVAVVANGAGPGVTVNASGSGTAVEATNSSTTGLAGFFQMNNSANNNAAVSISSNSNVAPALVVSNTGSSAGHAANFSISGTGNAGNVINANTTGSGFSGNFTGGQGFRTDGMMVDLKIVPNGGLVMGPVDYFFIIPTGTTGNLTLPTPTASNKGKIYVVKTLGTGYNVGGTNFYTSDTGVPNQTNFPANSVTRLVCDGSVWQAW